MPQLFVPDRDLQHLLQPNHDFHQSQRIESKVGHQPEVIPGLAELSAALGLYIAFDHPEDDWGQKLGPGGFSELAGRLVGGG